MKRLLTVMLGLTFLTTTVLVVHAQSTANTSKATKKKGGRKPPMPKTSTATKK